MEPNTEQAVHAEATGKTDGTDATATRDESALVVDELLIEDVSIDGMCGVY